MGDRSGNIRWWDVTTGHTSSFNTHREGIRRIKFSPVVIGDRSRGRIAVLFYDNTFSVYDLVSRVDASFLHMFFINDCAPYVPIFCFFFGGVGVGDPPELFNALQL